MFRRGDVVQHDQSKWIGVVDYIDDQDAVVKWLDRDARDAICDPRRLIPIDGWEFEAALALGDTAKVLEMYRALQFALTPFARFGQLQHRYANEALFTIAYDRNGAEVVIRYADFVRAAELVADAAGSRRSLSVRTTRL